MVSSRTLSSAEKPFEGKSIRSDETRAPAFAVADTLRTNNFSSKSWKSTWMLEMSPVNSKFSINVSRVEGE